MNRFLTLCYAGLALLAAGACQRHSTPSATAAECIDQSRVNPSGICTMEYEPVCGCNNVTYANACGARNAGVRTFKPGPCPTQPAR